MNENSNAMRTAVVWTAVGILGLVLVTELAAAAVVRVVLSVMSEEDE